MKTVKKQKLNPAQVKLIRSFKGVDGNCTIITVNNDFAKEVISGRVQVFQLLSSPIFYISKDKGEITIAHFGGFSSRKKAEEQISKLLSDNPAIFEEFKTLNANEKNIFYILKKYNQYYLK